jgi:glutathione S-transferase
VTVACGLGRDKNFRRPSICAAAERRIVAAAWRRHRINREQHMSELQIIGAPQSNFVWVTRIACEEKGVAYTLLTVMPHTPEVDAIHPFGKIPAMRHGDVTLCESRAICRYIDAVFAGPALVPTDPAEGARTEQWISIINTHIDPVVVRRYLGGYVFPRTADGSPDRARIDGALAEMEAQLGVLDKAVGPTGYLAGKQFTLADIDLVPILYYLEKMPESGAMLRRSKNLAGYLERQLARPSIRSTIPPPFPGRQPSAEAAAE